MEGKMLHLRVPKRLYASCVQIVKENGYGSVQEFVRESVRRRLEDYKKEEAIKTLEKLKGSMKGIKRLSKEELDKAAEKYVKEDPSKILREHGLY